MKKVILLEFNELCPGLLERFINEGHLPNFARLYKGAQTYVTNATGTEASPDHLEPWIQWVTLHTGKRFDEHNIFRLGQANKLEYKNIWDELSEQNKSSWVCGSMNAKFDAQDSSVACLPDPWSVDASASPKDLQPFYEFVRANVQEHTNEKNKMSFKKNVNFLGFMLRNGLSFNTICRLAKIVLQQVTKSKNRWQKASILDWLQFDVFRHYYSQKSPAFSTFFSNSTAHFQHKYWRYMEPEKFSLAPSEKDIELYGEAILFAYKNHDQIIGKVFDLADENTTIMLASALSQQPFTKYDGEGGKRFHRPYDITKLPSIFDLSGVDKVNPVMSHQFQLIFKDTSHAEVGFDKLMSIELDGQKLFSLIRKDSEVYGGCSFRQAFNGNPLFDYEGKQLNFNDIFYLADSLKSGMHNPEGVFWVQAQQPSTKPTKIPLEGVKDLILGELS